MEYSIFNCDSMKHKVILPPRMGQCNPCIYTPDYVQHATHHVSYVSGGFLSNNVLSTHKVAAVM